MKDIWGNSTSANAQRTFRFAVWPVGSTGPFWAAKAKWQQCTSQLPLEYGSCSNNSSQNRSSYSTCNNKSYRRSLWLELRNLQPDLTPKLSKKWPNLKILIPLWLVRRKFSSVNHRNIFFLLDWTRLCWGRICMQNIKPTQQRECKLPIPHYSLLHCLSLLIRWCNKSEA